MSDSIRVEYVDLEEVKQWPRNPKDHDLHEIKKSFNRFGFVKPILIDEGTGQLVAGHGRLDALRILRRNNKDAPRGVRVNGDIWKVPVLRGVAFKNEEEAEAFLLADNRLSEIGGWKKDLLSEILNEMVGDDNEEFLFGTGFDISDLVGSAKKEEKSKDIDEEYLVVVTCRSEVEQADLLNELMERGINCKALIG